MRGVDLGSIVADARAAGMLVGGGGHEMAAGIKFKGEHLDRVLEWFAARCDNLNYETDPVFDVLGAVELMPPAEWDKLILRLSPFGNGSERPHLLVERAKLVEGPDPLAKKDASGEIWGWRASFELPNLKKLTLTWKSSEEPPRIWSAGLCYRMVVSLSIKPRTNGGVWENWDVQACELLAS
jgi:hypothetical protein